MLGRVQDFAVDVSNGRIKYVVVSVGSFLIDNNLIAVAPQALTADKKGQYIVLNSDDLAGAERFGTESWPDRADVFANAEVAEQSAALVSPTDAQSNTDSQAADEPIATISDGRRTGTIRSGERQASIVGEPEKANAPQVGVEPKRWQDNRPAMADSEFEQLDEDGDGYLTRREIGPRMQPHHRFDAFDLDGNDGIDVFEFQVMKQ